MLNNIQGTEIQAECRRLKQNLTQRGFRRLMARVFGQSTEAELVFDLQAGESPKKSLFERMAAHADKELAEALEFAQHFSIIEKKRSPKNGTVTYRLQATYDIAGPHHQLRDALRELEKLGEACRDVDVQGIKMFAG